MHALALLVIFISLALPAYSSSNSSNSEVFLPVNIREYEAAMGIQRRAEEDLVDMRPKPHADLIYGRPGKNEQILLAHMKLHASDGMDIVLMERFEDLTKSVDCHGQDGILSLTFKSKAAFNRALEAWSFINEAEEIQFLLITNHEDCSPSDQRRPYVVTNIRDDLSTLTTFLTALEVPWRQVAGTFDLDVGKAVLPTKPVSRRILGRMDRGILTSTRVNAGEPGNKVNLLPGGHSKNDRVDCVDCYVKGYFEIMGHFSSVALAVTEAHLEVKMEDFHAAMSVEVTIEKQGKVKQLSNEKTIADVAVPGAGVVIRDIIDVGLHVQFAAGFTTKLKSAITFQAGLEATLPWTSKIVLDAIHFEKNAVSGFEGFQVYPIFDLKSLSRTADVSLAAKPKLVFGIDIVGIAKYEVSAIVNLPELKGTCTVKYKSKGLCENDPEALKTGVEVAAKLDLELDLQIDAVNGDTKEDEPRWQQKLWSADANFAKICVPLDIPNLKIRKGKLVASNDLSGLGPFSGDDEEYSDDGSDDGSDEDSNIFASEPDATNAPATNSDPAQTDIFAPEPDPAASSTDIFAPEPSSAASGTDTTTPVRDSAASGTDTTTSTTEEASSTDPPIASDFSNIFQSPTDPDFSSLPDFTTAPETSPVSEPALPLTGSEFLPESTPPPDASPPDTLLAMDTFLSPEPSVTQAQSDSSTLPERNSEPEGQLGTLGEGSNFDYTQFLPSETATASASSSNDQTDQSLVSFSPDDPGAVQDRSSLPLDNVYDSTLPVFEGGDVSTSTLSTDTGTSTSTAENLPELGEGSTFNEPPAPLSASTSSSTPAYDLFSDGLGDLGMGAGTSTQGDDGSGSGTGDGGVFGGDYVV